MRRDKLETASVVGIIFFFLIWFVGLLLTVGFWTAIALIILDAFQVIDVVGFV